MQGFEDLEALAAMTGLVGSSDAPELEELEQQHSRLSAVMKPFSRDKALACIAALLTYPEFHANTIRLETLQQIAQRNCCGSNAPTRHRLGHWVKEIGKGWAGKMEDPVEDVFISNVVTNVGNSRVFEGVWEANDFWLQQSLNALRAFRGEPWADKLFVVYNGLLSLSEELARRCNLDRFTMGAGSTRADLNLPLEVELQTRAAYLRFSETDLSALGVPRAALQDFIHLEQPAVGSESNSTLQRRPLQEYDGDLIVALPAAISPAIRQHLSEQVVRGDKVAPYESALFTLQINSLFLDGIDHLGATRVEVENLPPISANSPIQVQEVAQFDVGMFAHIVFVGDRVIDYADSGVTGVLDLVKEDAPEVVEHTRQCAELLAARTDFRGGLTIVVVGGLGRSFVCGIGEFPPHWYGLAFRLPDLLALCRVHYTRLLDVWKLKEQQLTLRARGVKFMNLNGELNLLGFWQHHGERLVPRSVPLDGMAMVHVGTDFIGAVRHEMRAKYDAHAVPRRNPDVWAAVRRYNIDSYFPEVDDTRIYADEQAVRKGQLRGVVESETRFWWLTTIGSYPERLHRDTQFRIWEAILNWLPKFVSVAEQIFHNLPIGPIEILLRFDRLETWRAEGFHEASGPAPEIVVRKSRRFPIVELRIPVEFLSLFARPENTAERELIQACFRGIASLPDEPTVDYQAAVQSVVSNDDARFFHLAYAQDFRQHIGSTDRLQPRLVHEGDVNFASAGVVQRLLPGVKAAALSGEAECNRFLHAVVDDCWERARAILQKLNRASVIIRALQNVEAIEQDRNQWTLTAKAVLATHADQNSVVTAAAERENDRSEAALVSRIIVEMAVCTCPCEGYPSNQADFDALAGVIRLLLYAATSSDAIKYELTEAKLELFPNGEFVADDSYYNTIIKPYVTEQFVDSFHSAAKDYARHFVNPATRNHADSQPLDQHFVDAFTTEYGLTPDELINAFGVVEAEGMKDERLVVTRTIQQLRDCFAASGLPHLKFDSLLEHFSLWPRAAWDKTPDGFLAKDWYPWRYRRRLSLLARPFVRLGDANQHGVIFAPGLIAECIDLLFTRLLSGWLPSEAFRSSVMRSWIGDITRRRGDDFETEVGAELQRLGLQALVSRPMAIFGAEESYGNLDVLAWAHDRCEVYAVECKRLRFARTVAEIGEQLHAFKGEEKDRLDRHLRRCRWLTEHLDNVLRVTGLKQSRIVVIPMLVTSTRVPMQFTKGLPIPSDHIVAFNNLTGWVSSL